MRNQAIQSNIPFVAPSDEVIYQEFASGETHQDTVISDEPPDSTHHEALHPDPNEEHSTEFMFDDDSASVATPPVFSSFHALQKPSSSRPIYDFVLLSTSLDLVDEEFHIDNQVQNTLGGAIKSNPPKQTIEKNHTPLEPLINKSGKKSKSQSSTSDNEASAKNLVDPFFVLELRDKISAIISKVEFLDKLFAMLDSKIDAKVSSLETKPDAILQSLSEVKKVGPTDAEMVEQLDQLISMRFKHTLEEVE